MKVIITIVAALALLTLCVIISIRNAYEMNDGEDEK